MRERSWPRASNPGVFTLPHSKANSEVCAKKFPAHKLFLSSSNEGWVVVGKNHDLIIRFFWCMQHAPPPKKMRSLALKNLQLPTHICKYLYIYIYICCLCVAPSYTKMTWPEIASGDIQRTKPSWTPSFGTASRTWNAFHSALRWLKKGKGVGRSHGVPGSGRVSDVSWCENVMGFLPWFQQHPKTTTIHGSWKPRKKWPCTRVHNRVIPLLMGVIAPFLTGRDPLCMCKMYYMHPVSITWDNHTFRSHTFRSSNN